VVHKSDNRPMLDIEVSIPDANTVRCQDGKVKTGGYFGVSHLFSIPSVFLPIGLATYHFLW